MVEFKSNRRSMTEFKYRLPLRRPVHTPFSPLDCGYKVTAYYDPSERRTVTSSSGLVTQVNDLSQSGFNISTTGASRPTLLTESQNNRDVIDFGTVGYLDYTNPVISSGSPFVQVFQIGRVNTVTASRNLWEIGPTTQTANQAFRSIILNTRAFYLSNIGNDQTTNNSAVVVDTYYLLETKINSGAFSSSNPKLLINGTESQTGTPTGTPTIPGTHQLRIGARLSGVPGQPSDTRMGDWVMVTEELNDSQEERMRTNLQLKWGIS